ncbi:DUF192 domain-containing protein [Salipiger sp.]|uniref:DUF192 domain-containing protein n=1 Tax=Salipiger sp. TaxID=2078585 RepID=UPI003A96E331
MGIRHSVLSLLALLIAAPAAAACRDDTVMLRGDWGGARFRVAVADDAAERARGLMFVEEMAPSTGMLFVYEREQPTAFWMKNTLIPLDMIFADAEGRVVSVHSDAVPHDETPIPSGGAVQYVLEINGGLAARMGIVSGSEMQHPAINGAAWPCD